MDYKFHVVGEGEGGYEASGVVEKTGRGRHKVGGVFKLPQSANTPIVDEGPRGKRNPGRDQSGSGPTEGGWTGAGGDENPPTTRATRMQGANGGDGEPMGGQQTLEPPNTIETVEEYCSAGAQPRQSNGARS